MILGNRAILGSVNANVIDWRAAMRGSRPPAGAGRVRSSAASGCAWASTTSSEAFAFGGVKAALAL